MGYTIAQSPCFVSRPMLFTQFCDDEWPFRKAYIYFMPPNICSLFLRRTPIRYIYYKAQSIITLLKNNTFLEVPLQYSFVLFAGTVANAE